MNNKSLFSCFRAMVTILLCLICITGLYACGGVKDYPEHKDYIYLFSADDDDVTKELKNSLISQIVAYNKGDASTYYAPFEMEKEDLGFNIAEYKSLWNKYILSYHIEEMNCAFLDESNAQVELTLHAKASSRSDGTELYDYVMKTVYTIQKEGKTWKIITQSDSQIVG